MFNFIAESTQKLNKIGKVDKTFFLIIAIVIALCVLIYFLIPVLNKKQYKEQRDNLRKREEAFKKNRSVSQDSTKE